MCPAVHFLCRLCVRPLFLQFKVFCRSLCGVGSRALRWYRTTSLSVRAYSPRASFRIILTSAFRWQSDGSVHHSPVFYSFRCILFGFHVLLLWRIVICICPVQIQGSPFYEERIKLGLDDSTIPFWKHTRKVFMDKQRSEKTLMTSTRIRMTPKKHPFKIQNS